MSYHVLYCIRLYCDVKFLLHTLACCVVLYFAAYVVSCCISRLMLCGVVFHGLCCVVYVISQHFSISSALSHLLA